MGKIKVYDIVFFQSDKDVAPILEHFGVDSLSEISRPELASYLIETYDEGNRDSFTERDEDDLDTEFLGHRVDKTDDEKGYLLSFNSSLGYAGLSYFEALDKKEKPRIDRSSLDNVGNTNGRDVKCQKCGEPWENYGIVHDFTQEEIDRWVILGAQLDDPSGPKTRIKGLSGCPACADRE